MRQPAVVLLALFEQMERTYTLGSVWRIAHQQPHGGGTGGHQGGHQDVSPSGSQCPVATRCIKHIYECAYTPH